MSNNIHKFVERHFFALQKAACDEDHFSFENTQLNEAFIKAGMSGNHWTGALAEMESLVGAPIAAWHSGHLAWLKGNTLPAWEKKDAYIGGFSTAKRLEDLQRQAADTLAKMKYAFVRETLTHHAQLHGPEVQSMMGIFLKELQDKSQKDPLVFLGHLAHRRFALSLFSNTTKPSASWSKNDKTTELVRQLANLTYLEIQRSLSAHNDSEQKNVPTSTVADISVR